MMQRCHWCLQGGDIYIEYHDKEWGVPVHDDRTHFEFLILEGAQAGLSWLTILKRREGYRKAFAGFDADKVSRYSDAKKEALLNDPGIIRNRLKVTGAVNNAKRFLEVQREFGTFDHYIWSFVNHSTIHNTRREKGDVPATTPESDALAADMKKRGFKFCGPTIVYAVMQAMGMVNDHIEGCAVRETVEKQRAAFKRPRS